MIRYLGRGDSEYVPFPGIEEVGEYDTIAWGGDLSVRRLWDAYSHGIFPWYPYRSKAIVWTCPRERFVIFPKEVHVSHSMRTLLNSGRYRVTFNECFEAVIMNCATVENRHAHKYAWLGGPLLEAMLEFTVISGGMLFAEAPPFGCVPVYGHVSGGTAEAFRLYHRDTGHHVSLFRRTI